MNDRLYKPKELSAYLGVTQHTLTQWEKEGKIQATKTPGGHRRYTYVDTHPKNSESKTKYIYASKQKEDLQRQIKSLQEAYPDYEVIQDIGSGINFKRRGLITLLDNVLGGKVSHVVVAHRDRLTRFGFEMFIYLFNRLNVSIQVMSDDDIKEPTTELAKDLLSIVTVFTARYYGSRSYKTLSKNKILPESRTKSSTKSMHRGVKVFFQQSSIDSKRKRNKGSINKGKITPISDEE
jgi:putative resolvase